MKLTYICKICGFESSNNNGLISHVAQIHKLTSKNYYDKFFKKENEEICPVCGNLNNFNSFSSGYFKTCSQSCAQILNAEHRKQVRYKKYGEGNYCSKEGLENISKENSKNYKVRIEKTIKNLKQKYNISDDIKIANISQFQFVKDRKEQTALEKYGVKNNFLIKDNNGIEKRINTSLEKYGVKYPMQNENIQEKTKNTNIKKYGCENPMQNYSIFKNTMKKYKYNNITFDSSWEIAYYIWLTDHNIKFEYQPKFIEYFWSGDNKLHKYYPDFKINNEYIEIKRPDLFENMIIENGSKENAKYKCMIKNNVKIITDCSEYLNYIKEKYGNDYLKQFKFKN